MFAAFSYIRIPHDAGDFSLMDKRVVGWLLHLPGARLVPARPARLCRLQPDRCRLRAAEADVRHKHQQPVPQHRLGQARDTSFSNTPLNMLTAGGLLLLVLSAVLAFAAVLIRVLAPGMVERGQTTILLAILFFGAINLFAVGLVGEYVAKIMEEVKGRPRLIRAALIKDGDVTQLLPEPRAR